MSETVDDETIIVNLDTGSYYDLNHVGACIWEQVERGQTPGEAAAQVVARLAPERTRRGGRWMTSSPSWSRRV
jgi:hypothetical protein